jgi:phosphohistidine phosphatase
MTMKLILVRHGAAVERSVGITEGSRFLTPEGRAFFRKTARTMQDKGTAPELILTSPLIRAVQTADILAETIAYGGPLLVREELQPGFAMAHLRTLLAEFQTVGELVLVGHEPDLSGIVAKLLALPAWVDFRKGTSVRLKIDPADPQGSATFKWLAAGRELIASKAEAFALS